MIKMKNSGVEWIGKIPEHWNLIRLKDKFRSIKEIVGDQVLEFDRLALTLNGVIKRDKEDDKGLQPKDFDNYQILRAGDFVFKMIDLQNISTSRVGLSPYDGIVSPAYLRFAPKDNKPNKYIYYFLMSLYYNCVFNSIGGDGVRSSLSAQDMGNIVCPFPGYDEQHKIADFLDKKCSQIERLIKLQESEIEKLKEYKTNIITDVITKGLDKNVKLRDSESEWFRKIPDNYKIVKIKNVCSEKITDGTHTTPTYTSKEEGFPFLSSKDVRNGYIDFSDIKYITIDVHNEISKGMTPQKGDVLLSKNGSIGFSAVVETDDKFDIYVTLAILRPNKKILSKYLKYSLDCLTTQKQFNLHLLGIGVPNLHLNIIQDVKILLPMIDEQKEIVNHLDNKCSKIDEMIITKQKKIEELQKYKKSLIYECVTGKKEI